MNTRSTPPNPFSRIGMQTSGSAHLTDLESSSISIARFRTDDPANDVTKSLPAQDAFLVILPLADLPSHEFWSDGRHERRGLFLASEFNIIDLNASPACRIAGAFDYLQLHLPRASLDDIADEASAPRVADLRTQDGWKACDPVLARIARCLRDALDDPGEGSRLFTDHIVLAAGVHLARAYGGLREGSRRAKGGLAPWQERRSREMIAAGIAGTLSIAAVAAECGLSPAHFARSFKASTGVTPHRWLQTVRVACAKDMLRSGEASLAETALACGFADQSHFTRIFTRIAGEPPGRWRRFRGTV